MNARVAVRALGREGTAPSGGTILIGHCARLPADRRVDAVSADVEVGLVTLQADERLVLPEQIVGHRAVRLVASVAAFLDRRVLEDEGTMLGRVTTRAQLVHPFRRIEQGILRAAVNGVARRTLHALLDDGVVRAVADLCLLVLVAVKA